MNKKEYCVWWITERAGDKCRMYADFKTKNAAERFQRLLNRKSSLNFVTELPWHKTAVRYVRPLLLNQETQA